MSQSERVTIPLLEQLIPGGVRPGTVFVVEFDSDSQWPAISLSMTAKYLSNGGSVVYSTFSRPPEDVTRDLANLGTNVPSFYKEGWLHIADWYTATTIGGRLPSASLFEPYEFGLRHSLSVADFGIFQSQANKAQSQGKPDPHPDYPIPLTQPGWLFIFDSLSVMLRFNEERPFLEWLETREHRGARSGGRINLEAFVRGLHNELFYKRVEAACDGVIDVKALERDETIKNVLRVRVLKGQPHDNRWHEIEIKPSGEATLVT